MAGGTTLVLLALGYVCLLFAIAWIGDAVATRRAAQTENARDVSTGRPIIYALTIAVYCTSWTFFGSVGSAANRGYDFFGVYLGPILFFLFGMRFIERVIALAKRHNSTSVADFLAARYGGSLAVSVAVTTVCLVGVLPYIALQLKAITASVEILLGINSIKPLKLPIDASFIVAFLMAAFAVLFGTRRADATEHQGGMMLAIAGESLVKLVAFLAVGMYVLVVVFGGPSAFITQLTTHPDLVPVFMSGINPTTFATYTLLSLLMVLLLPRQFHVTVVENTTRLETKRARWLFPGYLILINIFVVPIAAAGILTLPRSVPADNYVMALPIAADSLSMTAMAFIGGLSAGTAMIIVDTVALSIMLTNSFVVPLLVRKTRAQNLNDGRNADYTATALPDGTKGTAPLAALQVIIARRLTIFIVVLLGYWFYRAFANVGNLVSIGLISFAAIAQIAPAFFGGFLWTRATALGATSAIAAGFAVWGYTLFLPWALRAGYGSTALLVDGPFGIKALAPQSLGGLVLDPLAHGVLWSLAVNMAVFIVVSLLKPATSGETLAAQNFLDASHAVELRQSEPQVPLIALGELHAQMAPYIGEERTHRIFREHLAKMPDGGATVTHADAELIRRSKDLLTRVLGSASADVVVQIAIDNTRPADLKGAARPLSVDPTRNVATEAAAMASTWQSAVDSVTDGIAVFSKEAQLLQANRRLHEVLRLPPEIDEVGRNLADILAQIAESERLPLDQRGDFIADRMNRIAVDKSTFFQPVSGGQHILEVRTRSIRPDRQGAFVVTFTDLTDRLRAEDQLRTVNATLEARVEDRTREADAARGRADRASVEKSKFLAAAGHDVMQPLNAARLYAATMREMPEATEAQTRILGRIDSALNSVEEILGALTDIARLDQGKFQVQKTKFAVQDILDQLAIEFETQARAANLSFAIVRTSAWVETDPALLRRLLQNFISNAIKFTKKGGVLLGVRSDGNNWFITVTDTGPGIPASKRELIFEEFSRLDETAHTPGLGLGLSIVQRIAGVLNVKVDMRSVRGKGSTFGVRLPKMTPNAIVVSTLRGGVQPITDLSGLHVLVIDNEPRVLDGMQELLSRWGCTVVAAHSVGSAITATRGEQKRPDLICADYRLNDGTGLDAILHVRAAYGYAIPALVITADQAPDVDREIKLHGHPKLMKPVKAAMLRALATEVMRRSAQAAE